MWDSLSPQLAALRGVADCLLLFGMELVKSSAAAVAANAAASLAAASTDDGSAAAAAAASVLLSPADVLHSVASFMQDEDVELRTASVEALAKLLYLGRVADSGAFAGVRYEQ